MTKNLRVPTIRLLFALCVAVPLLAGNAARAGDAAAGRKKSVVCAGCHGATGISPNVLYPNIAGQKEVYLAKVLRLYRSGARKNRVMKVIVAEFSDKDLDDLAAYFSRQTCR